MNRLKVKLKIFFADLIHNQYGYNYGVPLNIACLAATIKQGFNESVDVRLFKFPDELLGALYDNPDILALSNYDWNFNLNKTIIRMAKRRNPDIFVVMGGPLIRRGQKGIKQFLEQNSYVDAYVLFEGEEAFAGIITHFLGHEGSLHESLIKKGVALPQVAYLAPDGRSLIMGPLCPSIGMERITHPSAWLSGYLDQFLNNQNFPLSPIIETTRGCPYECTYCTAGRTAGTGIKLIRQFDLNTVFEELEYIFKKTKQGFHLMIVDTNFGSFERDLQIAEKVRCLAEQYRMGTISVSIDTSKNMLQRNIEIYKILGNLCMPDLAQQTFNKDVLSNIKRKNVDFEEIKRVISAVHANGSNVCTDLLIGLPGETKEAHVTSVRMAFDADFDKFQVSDIRLLPGTEMEEDYSRERYGLKTKVRIIPNAFGVYGGEKVIEYENCIRQTSAMPEEEFLQLRLFHAHIFLMLNLEIGRPLLDFARDQGLHQVDLIAGVSEMPPNNDYPKLAKQFSDYIEHSSKEWFITQEEADTHYMQDEVFEKLQKKGFAKLNYDYASKLIVEPCLVKEFLNWIAYNIKMSMPEIDLTLIEEVVSFAERRIINFPVTDAPIEPIEMSDKALSGIRRYVANYSIGASSLLRRRLVEFVVDKQQNDKIRNMVESVTSARDDRHAVELVIQFRSKLFMRTARIASNTSKKSFVSHSNYFTK